MTRGTRVFLDANVFVTTWTLDVLLTLADRGALEPYWSDMVLEEARKAVDKVHATKGGARYLAAATHAFPYAMVEIGEEDYAGVELPDPDDCHVVGGALAAECGMIATYNMKDFPQEALAPLGLRAVHPDDLLMEMTVSNPDEIIAAVRSLVAAKKHPPRSLEEELEGLRANMLYSFADFIEEMTG